MKKFFLFSIIILHSYFLLAQQYEDFGFTRDLSVIVKDSLLNNLADPWGGGMNSCQFSQIDLNQDGIKDLFVYDRNSNKILTFINKGTHDSVNYVYAPEYRDKFPAMHDWVMLVDYNHDGKEDIFTSSSSYGGIAVYKNISDAGGLKFTLVANEIYEREDTTSSTIPVILYANTVDWPVIADMDNDGDIDIMAYSVFGSSIEYYKNMSMEKYGIPDSLDFIKQDYCWGNFVVSSVDNQITLDSCTLGRSPDPDDIKDNSKHVGSTLLALDLDGDGVKDLLIGDVGYPGIIKLNNSGTSTNANITSQDTLFPSNSKKVNLLSMPAPCFLDVDNDSIKDLILSPFDGGQNVSENIKSCWFYKNTGTNSSPVFEYQYDNFLQKDMIDVGSGAYPVLYDYDGDGLLDLFIGNYGVFNSYYYSYYILNSSYISKIALYKNTGTKTAPKFQFVTKDFANISSRKLNNVIPTFGDIDGDGVTEMIIGKSNGYIDLYKNTAPPGSPMNMVLVDTNYQGIHVGHPSTQYVPSSAPQLVDLDGDSLLDLVIGERNGNLDYFRNTGTKTNPIFTLMNDTLGGVLVSQKAISNYGYSIPCFFKDSTGKFRLFVGSETGGIYYYKDIENHLQKGQHFTLVDSNYLYIYEGGFSGIAVGNLNNDNYPDMIIGNYSGGVSYFKGTHPNLAGINEYASTSFINAELYPNPSDKDIFIKFPATLDIENSDLRLFDLMGRSIPYRISKSGTTFSIDVSSFANGIYFYSVSGIDKNSQKEFSASGKFIVAH